jgi:Zn-dependent protease
VITPVLFLEKIVLLSGGFTIAGLITSIIVVLIAMDVHEFAHAYVAYRMGDSTARDQGRMTLDPRANINWVGFAMFVLIGFGILGSAPVNEQRMYNRRWGMFAAVAAGPVSNLLLAALAAIPFWLGLAHLDFAAPRQLFPTVNMFLTTMIEFNVLLFLFNLLPLFPLDGWTIVAKLLPPDLGRTWEQYRTYSQFAFLGLILLPLIGINLLGTIIDPPLFWLFDMFTRPLLHLGGSRF